VTYLHIGLWRAGEQVYDSGPLTPGAEYRAPVPAGDWMVVRWLTDEEEEAGLDYEEMREGIPPP
jgi:hypothetical protein